MASVVLPTPPFWLRKLTIMNTCQKCVFAELRFSVYHHFHKWSNTELSEGGFTEMRKYGKAILTISRGNHA